MIKHSTLLLFLLLVLSVQAYAPKIIYKVGNGSISFRSDAPLELIKANSNEFVGLIDNEKKSFAFKIKLNSFQGFNNPFQREHFNENYVESSKYPYATFEGKIIEDIDFNIDGDYSIRTKGNLTIHGVTQERIIKSQINIKNKKINIQSNFTVLLADHNITIPKVVHEKLASEIKVEVKATLVVK
jgi:polyisoprenoid-binding protein YceI